MVDVWVTGRDTRLRSVPFCYEAHGGQQHVSGEESAVSGLDYREWQRGRLMVGTRAFRVATKPGVFAHGRDDPAAAMLAEAVAAARATVVVSMPCGNGLVGVVAAASGATDVWMADRQALGVEASRRSVAMQTAHGAAATTVGEATPSIAGSSPRVTVCLGHGASALPSGLVADVVALRVVPEKMAMLQLIVDALALLRPGGVCYLAGGNHEGAKAAAKLLERVFGSAKLMNQHSSHRLVMAVRPVQPPPLPSDLASPFLDAARFNEVHVTLAGRPFTVFTRPGVFSWEHLDEASEVLAGLINVAPGESVLDIGCGAGALGAVAALQSVTGEVVMVDADSEAVRCAKRTLHAAGIHNARAIVSDVASALHDDARYGTFDVVVANPPFHTGKHTDLNVPRQFMREAFEALRVGGRLLLVANRTLPYEAELVSLFGAYRAVHDGPRFKVLQAIKTTTRHAPSP